jgi:formylglycine-generating enzyme required for sulfatase activity
MTGGVQQPWVSSSPIDGDFYFTALPTVASVAAPLLGATARPPSAAGGFPVSVGQSFRDCPTCPEMVVLPAGTFAMGSQASETTREDVPYEIAMQERPRHSVRVGAPLAIGKFHLTRGEFARFVQASGHRADGGCYVYDGAGVRLDAARSWDDPGFAQTDRDPVVCVSWQDAQAYAQWLSRETGRGYRPPTEAEWEYAARGGTSSARWWGDSSEAQCRYANGGDQVARGGSPPDKGADRGCDDGFAYTSAAGSFPANPFGLHDMLGNAFQWVEDCWQSNYTGASGDAALAMISGDCGLRVLRGGSWSSVPWTLRAAYRISRPGDYRGNDAGFRVARTPAE